MYVLSVINHHVLANWLCCLKFIFTGSVLILLLIVNNFCYLSYGLSSMIHSKPKHKVFTSDLDDILDKTLLY